jgi:hypothetical protein
MVFTVVACTNHYESRCHLPQFDFPVVQLEASTLIHKVIYMHTVYKFSYRQCFNTFLDSESSCYHHTLFITM